ncbi:acyl carrier protein [Nocardia sp. NPDC050175]|uniref:acyl carrier protein n=1 Tax=Nocardia sp. NPDC050175 TaxID=3364317 RepID=UPI0037B3A4E4
MTSTPVSATEQRVLSIVQDRFDWNRHPTQTADLRSDLGLDSVHLVELQVAVEEHFHVVFDPFDEQLVEAFQTTAHLAAYIDYLAAKDN